MKNRKTALKILKYVTGGILAGGTAAAVHDHVRNKKEGRECKSLYEDCIKRGLDFCCGAAALTVFSPLFIALTAVGTVEMKGNPFFVQDRPGRDEKVFKLIKFRTMTNETDAEGNLLPDEDRLNKYGIFLRSTSLDELPEAYNILKGDMSVIGPRPWSVDYINYYTHIEHGRHQVRPGLSGYAQACGRTELDWQDRISCDLEYINRMSFLFDLKIILMTIVKTASRSDIVMTAEEQGDFSNFRIEQISKGIDPDVFYKNTIGRK